MNYQVIIHTDAGIHKKVNQDSVGRYILEWEGHQAVLGIVCDGVGGLNSGEVASLDTVKTLTEWFRYEFRQLVYQAENDESEENRSGDSADMPILAKLVSTRLQKIIEGQNTKLYQFAAARGLWMGTTMTVVLLYEDCYYIMQVGDSRVYEICAQSILQLTEDQSLVQREVKLGLLTKEEARTDKRRNIILQSIGSAETVKPVFQWGKIKENASFLLCTDGLIHLLQESEILSCLESRKQSGEWDSALSELVETVKNRGEKDNISAVLMTSLTEETLHIEN